MNNAFITQDTLKEENTKDVLPELRQRTEVLTDVIEALQNVGGSSYWKVLQKYVFDVDLDKAKRSLAKEKDTTEMFRLQGEIRSGERFSLETLITKYRNDLQTLRKKINE